MEENKDFDFGKHYGDEKETPPKHFWDDLEKQLPKKRKKRGLLFWISSSTAMAASLLLLGWGTMYFMDEGEVETKTTYQNDPAPKKEKESTIAEPSKSSTSKSAETETENSIDKQKSNYNPVKSTTQNNSLPVKKEKNETQFIESNTRVEEIKETKKEKPADKTFENQKPQNIELAVVEISGEKPLLTLEEKKDTTGKKDNSSEEQKTKKEPDFFVSIAGLAHTHTFNKVNQGMSIGLGATKKINQNWEARVGVSYMQINNPGLQRSSFREHFFVTKTTTTQQLEIVSLDYLSGSVKFDYAYKKFHFFGGVETMVLLNSKANLRTTEMKFSEERVTEQNDLDGFDKGVNSVVPQLIFGGAANLNENLRLELQFSHSVLPFGRKSLFTTGNNLRLSYLGIGINWRLKNL
jgi:hypothetical protein